MTRIVAQQLIDIILKVEDQASAAADKVDKKLQKFGESATRANNKATQSSQKFNQELLKSGENFQVVGEGAAQAANILGQMKLDPNFGSTMDRAKLSVSEMGYSLDSVKGKFMVIKTAAASALEPIKAKITSAAATIKSKFNAAVDSARTKLKSLSEGAKGLSGAFGALKGAMGMMVGMIGYDLVTGIVQAARESINAASQLDYFGQRLSKMTGEAKLSAEGFQNFKTQLGELQKEFRKVDMTAVGATAEEMAVKFRLPSDELGNLTRMTAIVSSAFVKEGSTQENAVLAVSDALDGQFRRLQEIGITQQTLKDNGWNGDLNDKKSLIDSINKSLDDLGFTETAKDITNLDEAWGALTVSGGQLLQKVLVPLTPVLIQVMEGIMRVADAIGPLIEGFVSFVSNMPDWAKFAGLAAGFAIAVQLVSTWITATLVPALALAALAALDFAAAMLANPLTWVALALAAVAFAIYEIGKAFGWWTNVQGMLSAIWAGLQRLWAAFINHPDVQGFLSAMGQAWNVVSGAIGRVVSWVGSFFNNSSAGKFDIVRALIDVVGLAWKQMTLPIRLVIAVIKLVWQAFNTMYQRGKANLDKIRTAFANLPGRIKSAISSLINVIVQPFKDAYEKVKGKVDDIKSYVNKLTNLNLGSITDAITKPFRDAYSAVCEWVDKIKQKAQEAANNPLGFLGFGGPDLLAYGGIDLLSDEKKAQLYKNDNLSVDMNQNLNLSLSLDLKNVPPGIDQDLLHGVVVDTITSKEVISQLVNNNDFQTLDNKVKARIISKNNRARGV